MPNYLTELSPDNNSHVYQIKDKEAAPIDLLKDTVGWTGKNLQPNTKPSGSSNGITFTVNDDGSITVNGTATANAFFELDHIIASAGTYIVSQGVSTGDVDIRIQVSDGSSAIAVIGSGDSISFTINATKEIYSVVRIGSGKTVNNLTFYPMIRKADIADSTYEPYHKSVEAEIEQIYADNGVLGAKNFCESRLSSATVNGITVTKNSDGSYTISGTNDGTAVSSIRIDQSTATGSDNLKKYHGDYILSILDANGNYVANTSLTVMQNNTWIQALQAVAANNGIAQGNIDKDDCFIYITIAKSADFTTPKTVYPMLRLATDPDDTYQPYAMTNRELTELTTVEEYTVSSNFTLDDSFKSVFKIGRIAFANIRITDISQATAYSTAICSLPAAVRPMKLTRLSILAGGNPIGAAVDTYGSIIPNAAINNGNAIICASWITS